MSMKWTLLEFVAKTEWKEKVPDYELDDTTH